jgi:hypothetical protein
MSTPLIYQISQRKEILRNEDTSITGVYKTIWSILKLKRELWYPLITILI